MLCDLLPLVCCVAPFPSSAKDAVQDAEFAITGCVLRRDAGGAVKAQGLEAHWLTAIRHVDRDVWIASEWPDSCEILAGSAFGGRLRLDVAADLHVVLGRQDRCQQHRGGPCRGKGGKGYRTSPMPGTMTRSSHNVAVHIECQCG